MAEEGTTPAEMASRSERIEAVLGGRTPSVGVADGFWLELVQWTPGTARSLWLHVNGKWRHLDDPDQGTQISVQDAFCQCPERLEVAVWYLGDVIVGLVVRSK